ncbi:MAG: TonB family protein [Rhodanobacteraceae bacterium]|nr:TonB family protein [Rhodanobacteraceae bacterium]
MASPEWLLRCGLVLSLALLLVWSLRHPLRRWCGARVAYGLWLLPPAALVAALLPAPVRVVSWAPLASIGEFAAPGAAAAEAGWRFADLAPALWAAGVLVALAWHWLAQRRFLAALRLRNCEGVARSAAVAAPMAIGLLRPRIVLPEDFEARYPPEAQALMLAHERAHLAAGDLPAQALATLVACACWPNPLAWWALRAFRHDQELACDARLLESRPAQRRPYADALLQAQLAGERLPAPLGCHWPTGHPLKERIAMLKHLPHTRLRRRGQAAMLVLALAFGGGVWATQAPVTVSAEAPTYAVRLLLSRPGHAPLMPSLLVRAGERAGIRSDDAELELQVSDGGDGMVYLQTELRLDGRLAGTPAIAMKTGEPGTVRIGSGVSDGIELTFWVSPQKRAPTASSPAGALADVRPPPRYPAQAMRDGIEGEVRVEFDVDATGVVRNPRILSAQPVGVFEEAVLTAVRGWWLNPQNQAQPLPASMQMPIHFRLDEDDLAPAG